MSAQVIHSRAGKANRGALKGHAGAARPTREPLKGTTMLGAWAAMAILVAFVLSGLKVLREYERAVVFRLERVVGARGPGIIYVIPGIEKAIRIDLRTITMDIPSQDVITKDNVSLKVSAVLYFRVLDPNRAVVVVENYLFATSQNAQTTLRSVCGEAELDQLLAEREKINAHLQSIIDQHTEPWGIKVVQVAIKFIDLPEEMRRVMAYQAEARAARQDHRRRGRVPGGAAAGGSGGDHGEGADRAAAPLPADPGGDRRGEQLDHHLPGADRHLEAAAPGGGRPYDVARYDSSSSTGAPKATATSG